MKTQVIAQTAHTDASGLNGCWAAVGAQLDGIALPQDVLSELTLNIYRGWFTFGADEGVLTVDRGVHPAAMDVLALRGPSQGRFVPAIFEHAGGMLRICYALVGTERPRQFNATLGSRRILITYRRVGAALDADAVGNRLQKAGAVVQFPKASTCRGGTNP